MRAERSAICATGAEKASAASFMKILRNYVETSLADFAPKPDLFPLDDYPLLSVDWSLTCNSRDLCFCIRGERERQGQERCHIPSGVSEGRAALYKLGCTRGHARLGKKGIGPFDPKCGQAVPRTRSLPGRRDPGHSEACGSSSLGHCERPQTLPRLQVLRRRMARRCAGALGSATYQDCFSVNSTSEAAIVRGNYCRLTRSRGLVPHGEASNRIASVDDLSNYKTCYPGVLVMNRMQAWSGMFAVASRNGLISPDYCVWRACWFV